ncbi:membrane protein [Aquipluma nitroreducens]|uniref:Membrane protein n=1 Tax=Aquipluma nitroreducens TaxID=2010828 RepID=A0A5K7SDE1_9BACT|nr:DMT family transporter [Aquipluma nitroreducens]BBE19467.1 membrane protein [Aquipluma nitroreducens]
MSNQTKGIVYTLITVLMWGVLAIALKIASGVIDSPTIVWFRFSLAFSGMAIWALFNDPKALKILYKPSFILVISTLMLAWNYIGFMWGVQYTTPGNAQVAVQTGQVVLAIFGVVFFKEKLSWMQGFGFLLALIGFWIFYQQHLTALPADKSEYTKGTLLTVSAALTWAVYAAMQKKLIHQHPVTTLNLFIFGLPVLLYLPFANFSSLAHLSLGYWLLLIFLGMNTLISYVCLTLALKYMEAGKVSVLLIMNPIITFVIMGILTWLQITWIAPEHFSVLSILGALLALSGAILVVRKKKKAEVVS